MLSDFLKVNIRERTISIADKAPKQVANSSEDMWKDTIALLFGI